ncbi:hypothetical protein BC835DRAFT_1305848 [Cytidiella melzeri]|nr:hypothetical protein BC835DRAFT_1305848 [Cytidiella melzeri]
MPSKTQRSGRSTRGGDSERLIITIPRRLRASPSDASSTTKTSLARRSTRSSRHATSSTPATTPAGIPELVENRDRSVPLKAEEEADLDALSLSIERYTPEGHCSHELCALVRPILVNLGDYHSSAYGRDHANVLDVAAAKLEALAQSPDTTTLRCRFCEGNKPRVFKQKSVTAFNLGRHLRVHLCKEHKPYRCQYPGCDHVDTQESNMYTHASKHADEVYLRSANKSFACKQCGKSCRNPSALYRHRKQEHSGESTPDLVAAQEAELAGDNSEEEDEEPAALHHNFPVYRPPVWHAGHWSMVHAAPVLRIDKPDASCEMHEQCAEYKWDWSKLKTDSFQADVFDAPCDLANATPDHAWNWNQRSSFVGAFRPAGEVEW